MEAFSALPTLCAGNSPVTGEFPHNGQQRGALMFSLICALNKRLSKQSWGWWFEMPSRSLWHHCNELKKCLIYVLWYLRYLISCLVRYDEIHCTKLFWDIYVFRHWGQDKMKALSQTTVSNARYRMKMFEFQLIFCWSLFLRVQLTILLHWSDNGLAPARWQAIIWTNGG